jgi:hypothetical protein
MKYLLIPAVVVITSLSGVNTSTAGLFDRCGSCASAVRSCAKSACSCVRPASSCCARCDKSRCEKSSCKKTLHEKLKALLPTPAPSGSLVNSLPVQLQTQSADPQAQSGTRNSGDRLSELERRMTRLEGIVVGMEKSLSQNLAKTDEILNRFDARVGSQN